MLFGSACVSSNRPTPLFTFFSLTSKVFSWWPFVLQASVQSSFLMARSFPTDGNGFSLMPAKFRWFPRDVPSAGILRPVVPRQRSMHSDDNCSRIVFYSGPDRKFSGVIFEEFRISLRAFKFDLGCRKLTTNYHPLLPTDDGFSLTGSEPA